MAWAFPVGMVLRTAVVSSSLAFAATIVAAPALRAQAKPPASSASGKADMGKKDMSHDAGHEMSEEHHMGGWKEMGAFHDVMSSAWHPAKNDSLAPARATASKLVAAARTWAGSAAPMGCDGTEVKGAIARLVPESEVVASLVARNANDSAVKAALKTVHDSFHVVEEGCKPMKHESEG